MSPPPHHGTASTPDRHDWPTASTITNTSRLFCQCGATAVMNGWCMTHYTTDRRFSPTIREETP